MGMACSCQERVWYQERVWTSAPPQGYIPVIAFQLWPPGGIYFELSFWLLDYVNDLVQISVFIEHEDTWFAIICGGVVLFSTWLTCSLLFSGGRFTTVCKAARDSFLSGVVVKKWATAVLGPERVVEAPISGLVAPYGLSLSKQLSLLQACSAVLGLVLSAKAISTEQVSNEVYGRPAAAAILLPKKIFALRAWRLMGGIAELSAFAIASRVLHPVLIWPWYVLGAATQACLADKNNLMEFFFILIAFSSCMFGSGVSPVALPFGDGITKPVGGAPIMLVILVRFVAWSALCYAVDWQEGPLPKWGTLGRPMGRQVLQESFLQPSFVVAEASVACASSAYKFVATWGDVDFECQLASVHGMSTGSMLFHAFLLCSCATSTTLYILGLIWNLIFKVLTGAEKSTGAWQNRWRARMLRL